MSNKRFFWFNVPIFYLLHSLDLHSTFLGLSLGFTEANPLMVYVVQYPWLAIMVKMAIISTILFYVYRRKLQNRAYLLGFTTLHHILLLLVVGRNYYLITKLLGVL